MNRRLLRNITFVATLVVVLGSLSTALYSLRHNNTRMGELRAAVFEADESGDDQRLEEALQALRQHVLLHMNADLKPRDTESSGVKPIQLPHKYYRDVVARWEKLLKKEGADRAPLKAVRRICEAEKYGISQRPSCLFTEIGKYNEQKADVDLALDEIKDFPISELPPTELYVFDFPSPGWSPDLAGWSLVVFFLSLGSLIIRLLI